MTPITRRLFLHATALGSAASIPSLVGAQQAAASNYPDRPIRLVVGFSAGGVMDVGARMLGVELSRRLKQPVVVDNKPGAGAIPAISGVLAAPADGYTVLFHPVSSTSTVFFKKLPFDPLKDLQAASPVWLSSSFFIVNAALPVKTFAEFVSYAKAHPDAISSGSTYIGGQLWTDVMKKAAGVSLTNIPYKGSAPMTQALLANDIQAGVDGLMTYLPFIREGKVKALAYLGTKRFEGLPDVPTVTEAGYPQLTMGATTGLWVKAGTPAPVVARLNQVVNEIVATPEITARILASGVRPDSGSAEDFRRRVEKETAWWADAARIANYEPQ